MKKIIVSFVMLFACITTIHAQSKAGSATVKINESQTISLGSTYQRVLANNATGISYQWYSSNTSKASVSYSSYKTCTITGKAEGSCKVYFKASFYIDGYYRTYDFYWDVTVSGYTGGGSTVTPKSVTLTPSELTLSVGDIYAMKATVYPSNSSYSLQWVSDDESVATISKTGVVTAVSAGTTQIKVWLMDSNGINGYDVGFCSLTVKKTPVTSISGIPTSVTMERGTSQQLSWSVFPSDATNKTVTFSSSDNSVATVSSDGLIKAVSRGSCQIKASATDGSNVASTCDVTVAATATLDELSTEAPTAANDVDVTVKRTLIGGEWNTICLPFPIAQEHMAEVFGEGVALGAFDGCDVTKNSSGDVSAIHVKFSEASQIEANVPYIIRVANDMETIHVSQIDITPSEEPFVEKDPYTVGVGKNSATFYNRMIGTYVAQTVIPDQTLFINQNKFWYSTGKTTMKAFRAYFDFYDVLKDTDATSAKILLHFDNEEDVTGIENLLFRSNDLRSDAKAYDLQGCPISNVKSLKKGIYIINNKKYIVK